MDDFYSLEKLEVFQIANKIGDIVWNVVVHGIILRKILLASSLLDVQIPFQEILGKVTEDISLKKTYNFVITQEGH